MRKVICFLIILSFCFIGCRIEKDVSYSDYVLSSKYEITEQNDLELGCGLRLKYINYQDTDGYILTFLEDLPVEEDMQHIFSYSQDGRYYISIDSYFIEMDKQGMYNNDILSGILKKVYAEMTVKYGEDMREHLEILNPYIVSGNENCHYIDYLTVFNEKSNLLVYYHILVEDVRDIHNVLTSKWVGLPDNLQVLRNCLGVYDEFNYPKV